MSVSTDYERARKIGSLLDILLGPVSMAFLSIRRTRPHTLPAGINYTNTEWVLIETAIKNHSLHIIWELEELVKKYEPYLMLITLER